VKYERKDSREVLRFILSAFAHILIPHFRPSFLMDAQRFVSLYLYHSCCIWSEVLRGE